MCWEALGLRDLSDGHSPREGAQGSGVGTRHLEEGWMQQRMAVFNMTHCIRCRVYGLASESVVSVSASSEVSGTDIKIVRFLDKPVHTAFMCALLSFL